MANLCHALEPEEILVIANRTIPKSINIAKYYMSKRKIPPGNLVEVQVIGKETCSQIDYQAKVAMPVKRYLEKNKSKIHIRCLVLMYGIPLKISPPKIKPNERMKVLALKKRRDALKNQLQKIDKEQKKIRDDIKKELNRVNKKIGELEKSDQLASLDSEIALVLEKDYPLSSWILNPYFLGSRNKTLAIKKEHVLMVSRLDGPNVMIA